MTIDLDAAIAPYMDHAITALDGDARLLAGMARYHLGDVDAALQPVPAGSINRGKRMRPAVALLCAGAAGGDPMAAAPVGAAIELLHNFTLIHDDVQDESPTRRHRDTVWNIWGIGQAINAGDALFAAAHLPLYRIADNPGNAALTLQLLEAFDRMTIAIVDGQTLDLGFEGRSDVTPADYLTMIGGKTAAIVRYAAWAGALLGGADTARAEAFADFGLALGLGFQIQDDALGIWGAEADTGKAPADDIRRRKQSLPILLLRERIDAEALAELDRIYAVPEIGSGGIARVLDLLAAHDIQAAVAAHVMREHDRARECLIAAAAPEPNPSRDALLALV
ncbi:MAG: polyprenyl synthetase family protein, partial [Thermomicrobiales bacterium]